MGQDEKFLASSVWEGMSLAYATQLSDIEKKSTLQTHAGTLSAACSPLRRAALWRLNALKI